MSRLCGETCARTQFPSAHPLPNASCVTQKGTFQPSKTTTYGYKGSPDYVSKHVHERNSLPLSRCPTLAIYEHITFRYVESNLNVEPVR